MISGTKYDTLDMTPNTAYLKSLCGNATLSNAVVIDDLALKHPQELDVKERLERLIYLAEDRNITAKFVNGQKLF